MSNEQIKQSEETVRAAIADSGLDADRKMAAYGALADLVTAADNQPQQVGIPASEYLAKRYADPQKAVLIAKAKKRLAAFQAASEPAPTVRSELQVTLIQLAVFVVVFASVALAVNWHETKQDDRRNVCAAAGGQLFRGKCWTMPKEINLGVSP